MDEKKIEALQKKSRRSYYFAAAFSAAVFLAITSVLFFLLLTTPSGIAYLEESPKEMITGVIVLPALLAVGIYLLLYYLLRQLMKPSTRLLKVHMCCRSWRQRADFPTCPIRPKTDWTTTKSATVM